MSSAGDPPRAVARASWLCSLLRTVRLPRVAWNHKLADMIRKPPRLRAGDTIAAVSLSSGLAAQLPDRYAAGKRQLEEAFCLKVIEAPNALASDEWLYRHPEARAADLHWALENPDVRAVVSTIGGDDSIRLLPYLDLDLIRAHPQGAARVLGHHGRVDSILTRRCGQLLRPESHDRPGRTRWHSSICETRDPTRSVREPTVRT